jgi:maltose-binding protein MalE
MVGALRTARVLPSIPEMTAIRVAISKETIRALKGQITPEQALKNMDEQAYKILEKAGYFK